MKEILNELIKGSTILIETSDLPEFWDYCKKEASLYAFRYEYIETMVKITIDKNQTVLRNKV